MTQEFLSNSALGGDGKIYNTGGSNTDPNRRIDQYGWVQNFLPMLNAVLGHAAFAANAAQTALNAPGTLATSSTSMAVASGTHSITLNETGKAIGPGMYIVVAATGTPATNKMVGSVVTHNSLTGALQFSVPSDQVYGSGTFAAWSISITGAPPSALTFDKLARSSDTPLAAGNAFNWISATGTFTQTYASGATLSAGWMIYYLNAGTGIITHDPAGAETMDGLPSFDQFPGELRVIHWDGSVFTTFIIQPFHLARTSSLTSVCPPGYRAIGYDLVGASGGAGSGRRGASSSARGGGASGGAPARTRGVVPNSPGDVLALTIGAAGTAGAAITADSTDGAAGTDGGNTVLDVDSGTIVRTAYGGKGGAGGTTDQAATSGSGSLGKGSTATLGVDITGGLPSSTNFGGIGNNRNNVGEGGGGVANSASGGSTILGGAGSASGSIGGTTAVHGGSSVEGVPAGGLGAWITSSNTTPGALNAGSRGSYTAGSGSAGGTSGASPTAGTDGVAVTTNDYEVGSSGGGGGAATSTNPAGRGGHGGAPGGAPGGGGASVNGTNSGAGGNGAAGRGVIWGIV